MDNFESWEKKYKDKDLSLFPLEKNLYDTDYYEGASKIVQAVKEMYDDGVPFGHIMNILGINLRVGDDNVFPHRFAINKIARNEISQAHTMLDEHNLDEASRLLTFASKVCKCDDINATYKLFKDEYGLEDAIEYLFHYYIGFRFDVENKLIRDIKGWKSALKLAALITQTSVEDEFYAR